MRRAQARRPLRRDGLHTQPAALVLEALSTRGHHLRVRHLAYPPSAVCTGLPGRALSTAAHSCETNPLLVSCRQAPGKARTLSESAWRQRHCRQCSIWVTVCMWCSHLRTRRCRCHHAHAHLRASCSTSPFTLQATASMAVVMRARVRKRLCAQSFNPAVRVADRRRVCAGLRSKGRRAHRATSTSASASATRTYSFASKLLR